MEEEQKQKKHNWKFFVGALTGILLTVVCWFLYRGYFAVNVPGLGVITVTLPTYQVFHRSDPGKVDTEEVKRKIREVESYLDDEYLYGVDGKKLEDGVFAGMIASLNEEDPYAAYYSKEDYAEQLNDWKGTYSGVGIVVSLDEETGGIRVVRVMNGPAMEAGIKAGDIIIKAGGTDLRGMDLDQATSAYIKGEEGTFVDLSVLREGEELPFHVERRKIDSTSVYHSFIENDGKKYGYLYVSQFAGNTLAPFADAVDEFILKGAEGLIVDLRDNPGGDMNVCLDMVDYLLNDNLTLYTKELDTGRTLLLSVEERSGNASRYFAGDGHEADLPVIILVNEYSASASEIFTGVMRSYGYEVLGTTTYGKGIVQTVRMLYDMSGIKYTSAEYVLPDSERIHGIGITPDYVVEPSEEFLKTGADPDHPDPETDNQLAEAIRILGAE